MKTNAPRILLAIGTLMLAAGANAQELINNGGFETGFSGWTRADQFGSDGSFFSQTGTSTPIGNSPIAAPPEGAFAAMTDAQGPGSHVLYQNFLVPNNVTAATLRFSLLLNNQATAYTTPNTLDFATTALNQQARVDIMAGGSDPFSMNPADILQNVFSTPVGSSLTTPYTPFNIDLTALLASRAGQTLRLRFAEVDNVNIFNVGVDGVSLAVPAPSSLSLMVMPLILRRRSRR